MNKAWIAGAIVVITAGVSLWSYNKAVGLAVFVGSKTDAEQNLVMYAKDVNVKVVGKSCAETDSDGDHYISCTARFQETDGGPVTERYLECGSGAWGARTGGCKPKLGAYPMMPAPAAVAPAPVPPPALK